MRRIALIVVVVALVILGAMELRVRLASPETRVRWRIGEMIEGFNDARVGPCLRGVATSWSDERGRVDRERLANGLRYLFLQERDPKTKAFRFRVELEEEPVVAIDPANDAAAHVELVAHFECLTRDEWSTTWRVRIEAEMIDDEEEGWQVTVTERETLESDGKLAHG